jgi:hypothetical protein
MARRSSLDFGRKYSRTCQRSRPRKLSSCSGAGGSGSRGIGPCQPPHCCWNLSKLSGEFIIGSHEYRFFSSCSTLSQPSSVCSSSAGLRPSRANLIGFLSHCSASLGEPNTFTVSTHIPSHLAFLPNGLPSHLRTCQFLSRCPHLSTRHIVLTYSAGRSIRRACRSIRYRGLAELALLSEKLRVHLAFLPNGSEAAR